jgi:serine/threonine-protein kinase HipA
MSEKIWVYENWSKDEPIIIGTLFVDKIRGKEQIAFEYDPLWLKKSSYNFIIDPDLSLYSGRQYVPLDKSMFGIFADSCPDRWGRLLINRREAILAKHENRKPNKLSETDYMLAVFDEARMGALRFSKEKNEAFLSSEKALATPPWVSLSKLEAASLAFENDEPDLEVKWLNQLLAPGSSLGGARPKATIADQDGSLWIAKFPSKHDDWNTGAWEKIASELAVLCDLNVPETKLQNFSKVGSTFLTKRFDRNGAQRVHFSSAMTMLGKTDGEEGASYLDIASFLKSNGSNPKADLIELWKRIAFNMLITNSDDHLRNHGFILTQAGWQLSPMYDVNPTPYGNRLSLLVDEHDNSISKELLISVANYFTISESEGEAIFKKMQQIISKNINKIAKTNGLSSAATKRMSPAFRLCYEL